MSKTLLNPHHIDGVLESTHPNIKKLSIEVVDSENTIASDKSQISTTTANAKNLIWEPTFKDGKITFSTLELLQNVFYYPACGMDFSQVCENNYLLNRFIYVDYSHSEEEVISAISKKQVIKDYEVSVKRKLEPSELPNHEVIFGRTHEFLSKSDIRNTNHLPIDKVFYTESEVEELGMSDEHTTCHKKSWGAIWFVLKRVKNCKTLKPEYISIIYISADAVCAYKGLYYDLKKAPKALGLIQYGKAFGGAYSSLDEDESNFGRMVLKGKNPHFLIYGETTNWDNIGRPEGCFRGKYSQFISSYLAGGNNCHVWQNVSLSNQNYVIVKDANTGEMRALYSDGKEMPLK